MDCRGCAAGTEERCGGSPPTAEGSVKQMAAADKNKLKIRRAKSADAQRIAELSGQLGDPQTAVALTECKSVRVRERSFPTGSEPSVDSLRSLRRRILIGSKRGPSSRCSSLRDSGQAG